MKLKLSKTQAALVVQMIQGNLLVDKNLGMGISAKTRCYLVKTKSPDIIGAIPVNAQTINTMIDKGILIDAGSVYGGITHHFYKLNSELI